MEKKRLGQPLLSLLLKQFFEFWYYYLGAFVCLFLTHYIQSELPFIAKELADKISEGLDYPVTKLFYLAIGIVIFRTSSRLLFFYPARVLQKLLRVEVIKRLEASSPYRYMKHSKGQIFQVVGGDLEEVRALIGFALLQVCNIIIAMSVLVPKLMSFNKDVFIALIPMGVAFILFTIIVSSNRRFYRLTQDFQGEVQNFIIESYLGKSTIKNYHSEKSFLELFKKQSMFELMNFYKAGKRVSISIPLVPTGVGLSLIWGAHIIFRDNLGATSLILFSGFVFLFLEPIMFLSWIGVVFTRSAGAWSRVTELVNDLDKPSSMEVKLHDCERIKHFDDHYLLTIPFWDHDIDLKIKKEKFFIITGETGHGKTELILKIAEMFRSCGKKIAYVAQDPYLYNGTILENLQLGDEFDEEKKQKAYELLKVFGLDYLSSTKEDLFNLVVGEDGKRLSGGQAKRVALVKSLMCDSEIILWDDPFSSVDVVLEKEILDKLEKMNLLENKTVILTGHRYTTVLLSDEVVLVEKENGILESRNVNDLQKKGAIFEHFKKQLS
ncbi:MAG: ABC transporter ATP-binding protein [Bdellovibrionota bacterium]|nr:ABC transporter ATP-binding protein [Bdellovibrionota bacterium]